MVKFWPSWKRWSAQNFGFGPFNKAWKQDQIHKNINNVILWKILLTENFNAIFNVIICNRENISGFLKAFLQLLSLFKVFKVSYCWQGQAKASNSPQKKILQNWTVLKTFSTYVIYCVHVYNYAAVTNWYQ